MIIIGAKGLAKELEQIVSIDTNIQDHEILFFDNLSNDLPERLFGRFRILRSFNEAKEYLSKSEDKSFILGLGNPKYRHQLFTEFVKLGGVPKTIQSNNTEIGSFDVSIGDGCSLMSGAIVSNSVSIGKGCLVYYNSVITHDCKVGDFVEISPNATILGRSTVGDFTSVGAGAIILPDVTVGSHVVIGAGTVVLNDVPDNTTIVGVPGKIMSK